MSTVMIIINVGILVGAIATIYLASKWIDGYVERKWPDDS